MAAKTPVQASQTLCASFLLHMEPLDRLSFRPEASVCSAASHLHTPASVLPLRKPLTVCAVLSLAMAAQQRERVSMAGQGAAGRASSPATAAAAEVFSRECLTAENELWRGENVEVGVDLGRELEVLRVRLMELERTMLESQWVSHAGKSFSPPARTLPLETPEDVRADGVHPSEQGFSSCDMQHTAGSGVAMETVRSGRPSARNRRLKSRKQAAFSLKRVSSVCGKQEPGPQNIEEEKKPQRSRGRSVRGFPAFVLRDNAKKQLAEAEQRVLWEKLRTAKSLVVGKRRLQEELGFEPSEKMWASYMSISPHELVATLREGKTAQSRLVNANLRLVVSVARRYQNLGIDLADLIQEGTIGLVKGVEKFDYTRGFKFSTYAHWWILQGITRALARMSRAIRLPFHLHETVCRIRKIQSMEAGTEPVSLEDLSKTLKLSCPRVELALLESTYKLKSMDEPLPGDDPGRTLHQLITDPQKDNQPWQVLETARRHEIIERYIKAHLLPREREIIRLRYGLSPQYVYPVTRECIGGFCGLSRERVRQLEQVAISKLRSSKQELDLALFRSQ